MDSQLNPDDQSPSIIPQYHHFYSTLTQCSSVVIQNIRRITSKSDIKHYIQANKLKHRVKNWERISASKVLLQFWNPQQAQYYYNERNFNDEILGRPVNAYLNMDLDKKYIKKYMLDGVTSENQRIVFNIIKERFVCRMDIRYDSNDKWTAILSLFTFWDIHADALATIINSLAEINVQVYLYNQAEEPLKYSIFLVNFLPGNFNKIYRHEQALEEVWKLISWLGLAYDCYPTANIYTTNKKKTTQLACEARAVDTYAVLTCSSDEKTLQLFNSLKSYIYTNDQSYTRVFLNFLEGLAPNTYATLFTKNLINPQGMSVKRFQQQVVQIFRQVSSKLLFIELIPVNKQYKFNARLVFDSEEAGRQFLVLYPSLSSQLEHLYPKFDRMEFQIFVDKQELSQYYQLQKGYYQQAVKEKNKEIIEIAKQDFNKSIQKYWSQYYAYQQPMQQNYQSMQMGLPPPFLPQRTVPMIQPMPFQQPPQLPPFKADLLQQQSQYFPSQQGMRFNVNQNRRQMRGYGKPRQE